MKNKELTMFIVRIDSDNSSEPSQCTYYIYANTKAGAKRKLKSQLKKELELRFKTMSVTTEQEIIDNVNNSAEHILNALRSGAV